MSIKDRGQIKWVSLMLPEHRKGLEELAREDQEIERPLIDEQQLESLNYILAQSLKEKSRVKISFYERKRLKSISGTIRDYSFSKREINIEGDRPIPLAAIIDIKILGREEIP